MHTCLQGLLSPFEVGPVALPGFPASCTQLMGTRTGVTTTLFLFPSALTLMTHTLDSPGRY